MSDIFPWTDSTIVLSWLVGNPKQFKMYVGNRVSSIVDKIPPDRWNHVRGTDNPADCVSRGLLPSELPNHDLWWTGPTWLSLDSSLWPKQPSISAEHVPEEEKEICLVTIAQTDQPIIPFDCYSTFSRLQCVTAWTLRFVNNCRTHKVTITNPSLKVSELFAADRHLLTLSQWSYFSAEIAALKAKYPLPSSSCLLQLNPSYSVLRVGGREQYSKLSYSKMHPIIIRGMHPVTKLIIRLEHLHLLHAGPTLVSAALTCRFHITSMRKTVQSVTHQCITCRRQTTKPQSQMLGQLPLERVTPGAVFERVGVDYAGPFYIKHGMVRKPVVVKAYVCIFCFSCC